MQYGYLLWVCLVDHSRFQFQEILLFPVFKGSENVCDIPHDFEATKNVCDIPHDFEAIENVCDIPHDFQATKKVCHVIWFYCENEASNLYRNANDRHRMVPYHQTGKGKLSDFFFGGGQFNLIRIMQIA